MFCDELQIKLIAGKGGDGCVSFRREKFVPRGGPNGGDGGHGGDIIIRVNPHLNTLGALASKKVYQAPKGIPGKGKNMFGKNAEPLILEVPKGTIVFNKDKSKQLADLNNEGEEITITKGGKGGLGNARFVTSTHQAPRFAETGEPGEEKDILLELKLVADVGLIGLPSAGKSTLISVMSNARPKIAAYHFTTLVPNLGVVSMAKFGGSANDGFVVADIPGLIEGASEGKGLGHQFLKHVTRTKLLVHIIDGSLPGADKNYKTIIKELKDFDEKLSERKEIIVINKEDMLDEKALKKVEKEVKKATKDKEIFIISAITKEGLQPLIFAISKALQEIRKSEREGIKNIKLKKEIPVLQPHIEKVKYSIEKIQENKNHKVFFISGKRIDQIVIMTDTNNFEGVERIYQFLDKMGIKKAIERKGAKIGDKISIKGKVITYRP